MVAVYSYSTLVTIYQSTLFQIPEDWKLLQHAWDNLSQGAKFPVARSPLATKYFSLAIGICPFIFPELDLCEKKWRPNSLLWLLDSDLKFCALT
jgi:hypothetical protein